MKSPWPVVFVVVAIGFLRTTQAIPDEPAKTQTAAVDPMSGKKPGDVRDDNGLKIKLVWCPPGVVTMGATEPIAEIIKEPATTENIVPSDDDVVDAPNAKPTSKRNPRTTADIALAKVFLTKGYWIGKYEVTQSEWKQVMKTEPWKGQDLTKEGEDFPATWVSWDDATEFCRKLTEQERQAGRLSKDWEYTLPTDAQWERACRARTETRFCFGDDESKLGDYAWFADNADRAGEQYAHLVGKMKPNVWGICDMHGNVWEWCRDIYTQKLPGGRDPEVKQDENTNGSRRVMRGGCWFCRAGLCSSAVRSRSDPSSRSLSLGFRLALSAIH